MVTIKGSKDGIQVLLDSDLTLEDAKQQITEKFEATKDFFKSGKTVIPVAYTHLDVYKRQRIKRLGIYMLLFENKTVADAANFMRGMKAQEIAALCTERRCV